MKHIITAIILIILSVITWLAWGGLSNDMGTLIILLADTLIVFIALDNAKKPVKE